MKALIIFILTGFIQINGFSQTEHKTIKVKSINSNDLGNTADGDLTAYPGTIDKVINKFPCAKIVIPGHGQFGGLDLIRHTRELTKLIK